MLLHRLERERVVEQVHAVHQRDLLDPLARHVVPVGEAVDDERVARAHAQVERLDRHALRGEGVALAVVLDHRGRPRAAAPRRRADQSSSVPSSRPIRCVRDISRPPVPGLRGFMPRAHARLSRSTRCGSSVSRQAVGLCASRLITKATSWPWRRSAAATARLLARFSSGAPQVSVMGIGRAARAARRTVPTKREIRPKRAEARLVAGRCAGGSRSPTGGRAPRNAPACEPVRVQHRERAEARAHADAAPRRARARGEEVGERAGVAGGGGVRLGSVRRVEQRDAAAAAAARSRRMGDEAREPRRAARTPCRRGRRAAAAAARGSRVRRRPQPRVLGHGLGRRRVRGAASQAGGA